MTNVSDEQRSALEAKIERLRAARLMASQVVDSVRELMSEFDELRVGDLVAFKQHEGTRLSNARANLTGILNKMGVG